MKLTVRIKIFSLRLNYEEHSDFLFFFFFLSFLFSFVRSIEIRAYTRVILFTFSFSRLQRFSFLRLNLEKRSLSDVACHLVVEIERKRDRDNHLKTGTKENNLFAMLRSLIMLLRKVFFFFFLLAASL